MIMRIESLCTTQVITSFSGTEITRGTGFLYRFGQTLALVTNWHILSGLRPITGLQMRGCVYTPNWVGFHVSVKTVDGYLSLPFHSHCSQDMEALGFSILDTETEKDACV